MWRKPSCTVAGNVIGVATMEDSVDIPLKTYGGIKPPYDSKIPLLGIYSDKTVIEKDT